MLKIMENRASGVGQYILVQRTSGVAPRASSAPPSNNPNMVIKIDCITSYHI